MLTNILDMIGKICNSFKSIEKIIQLKRNVFDRDQKTIEKKKKIKRQFKILF